MANQLQLTAFPAKEGDCLLISYGDDSQPKHILIDGGRAWTYKNALADYLGQKGIDELELVVITHVDRDHIDGMLAMIQDEQLAVGVKNIWFNSWDHLNGNAIVTEDVDDEESFGAKMGEEISPLIIERSWPWNRHFNGWPVELADDPDDNVIAVGDVKLTLLSPDRDKLEALIPDWKKQCKKAGITPGAILEEYVVDDDDVESFGGINIDQLADEAFDNDHSRANGTSIAFILEYGGRRILLSGDAHVDLLEKSLRKLGATEQSPLRLDAFKIPHHGSKYNVSKDLLGLVDCDHYIVSTNGNYFEHPEDVAMARLIKFGTAGATIHFNYKTKFNDFWDNRDWKNTYGYKVSFPEQGADGFKTLSWQI